MRASTAAATSVADFVEQFPNDWLFVFAQRFHLLAPRRYAAAFSEIFYARRLKRLFVKRGFDFAQGIITELFEWSGMKREALKSLSVEAKSAATHSTNHDFNGKSHAAFLFFFSSALFA